VILAVAVLMSWVGWSVPWIARVPVALTLSQLPAAVLVLAWLAEHADHIDDAVRAAWARTRPAQTAAIRAVQTVREEA
jgi:hypothetical protein